MANSNLTPSPNVALLDAIQHVWSLKTVDDGSGNQQIVVSQAGGAVGGAANFTPAQITVGTAATLIAAARTGRQSLTITNTGTTPVYLGDSGVTTTTGQFLPGILGASITISTTAAIYGVVASGTQVVTEYELY